MKKIQIIQDTVIDTNNAQLDILKPANIVFDWQFGGIVIVNNQSGADCLVKAKNDVSDDLPYTVKDGTAISFFYDSGYFAVAPSVVSATNKEETEKFPSYVLGELNEPVDKKSKLIEVVESFKETGNFSLARGTITEDSDNYKTGTYALKASLTLNESSFNLNKPVSWDLSEISSLELDIYTEQEDNISTFQISLATASGALAYTHRIFFKGWNKIRLSMDDFTATGGATFSETITHIYLSMIPTDNTQAANITFDCLYKNVVTAKQVIFVFDDGLDSVVDRALPLLSGFGVKGCSAINKSNVGDTEYASLVGLQSLYSHGWDVLNHTDTHPDLSSLTYNEVADEILSVRKYLYENGFERASSAFIYPLNWSQIAEQVASDFGYLIARDTTGYLNNDVDGNLMRLKSIVTDYNTDFVTDVQPYLDKITQHGGTLIFTTHDLVETATTTYETSIALMTEIIEYIQANNIDVITMQDYIEYLYSLQ